jgi:spore coat polysaccharide biosynthesis protein SpsF
MIQGKKVIAVVQARMESTRLPGKVLIPLGGKPALGWVLERIAHSKYVDRIILAIPESNEAHKIYNSYINPNNGWKLISDIYYGTMDTMENVYKRVLSAVGSHTFEYDGDNYIYNSIRENKNVLNPLIVDITGDCPLVDPRHIDFLIEKMKGDTYIYSSNIVRRTWPDGCDIQVYYLDLFCEVYHKIENKKHLAHTGWNVLKYIENYLDRRDLIYSHEAVRELFWPELRLTLDTKEDYELLSHVFKTFKDYGTDFRVEDVIRYLRVNPSLVDINRKVKAKIPGEG